MADNWMLGETGALDDYIQTPPSNVFSNAATAVKDWYTAQPSWLDRARTENQKTSEAFQRGGMGEIAKQLASDTTEAQDLYGAFGVGNIKGVRPPVVPGALAATSEYRPPFYSAVEQAVQGAKQNAAPGQQWAGFLRNQPGVKPEEVEALKLGRLFEQPGSVPKEAVLGEIAANRVNVGEVVKGSPDYSLTSALEQERKIVRTRLNEARQQLAYGSIEPTNRDINKARVQELGDRDQALTDQIIAAQGQPTKFHQYTLPGGENYREMLLTLPGKKGWRSANGEFFGPDEIADPIVASTLRKVGGAPAEEVKFQSSHYDEPNILAHVRYNDRVIDGKKTLFVEEVQSDWHQAGKRRGYKPGGPFSDEDVRAFHDLSPEVWRSASQDERVQLRHEAAQHGEAGVPDAPFKTTWPELAMKRIIREAAEKGYDKVAWTPGSVQAERYDLSKHIDHVSFNHNPTNKEPGKIYVAAHPHGGGHPVIQGNFTPKEIEANLGKEIADQIVNGKDTYGAIQKEGLKVGGEGMKGFYDEILPATVNKLVKKHGGRVTQADMTAASAASPERVHTLDITPSLRAQAMKGFPLFTAGGVAATGIMGEMARQDEYR